MLCSTVLCCAVLCCAVPRPSLSTKYDDPSIMTNTEIPVILHEQRTPLWVAKLAVPFSSTITLGCFVSLPLTCVPDVQYVRMPLKAESMATTIKATFHSILRHDTLYQGPEIAALEYIYTHKPHPLPICFKQSLTVKLMHESKPWHSNMELHSTIFGKLLLD